VNKIEHSVDEGKIEYWVTCTNRDRSWFCCKPSDLLLIVTGFGVAEPGSDPTMINQLAMSQHSRNVKSLSSSIAVSDVKSKAKKPKNLRAKATPSKATPSKATPSNAIPSKVEKAGKRMAKTTLTRIPLKELPDTAYIPDEPRTTPSIASTQGIVNITSLAPETKETVGKKDGEIQVGTDEVDTRNDTGAKAKSSALETQSEGNRKLVYSEDSEDEAAPLPDYDLEVCQHKHS
jgi:hypothetical protein